MRVLAFHLPQFHPIPENDIWWGKGFTEWTNVTKARPAFRGHYQPHLPADLGFYDLRLPEARQAQAKLADRYGISGFVYYHYWFNGRRVLERPVKEMLELGEPTFPFCLCWANENWTRIWDGGEQHILLEQNYSAEDDIRHIDSLLPVFSDSRYIRVDGRPLFLVYRTGILPDPKATTTRWRQRSKAAGTGDLFLVRVESHGDRSEPRAMGFDAAMEFAPFDGLHSPMYRGWKARVASRLGLLPSGFRKHHFYDYAQVAAAMESAPTPAYPRFHSVSPGWDNSARREAGATILLDSTPERYERWLLHALRRTRAELPASQQVCFINAWNEWAEGNHLEPDQRWGRAYLEATRRSLSAAAA
jgi:lipopolysaccharide biosynthesis protein